MKEIVSFLLGMMFGASVVMAATIAIVKKAERDNDDKARKQLGD